METQPLHDSWVIRVGPAAVANRECFPDTEIHGVIASQLRPANGNAKRNGLWKSRPRPAAHLVRNQAVNETHCMVGESEQYVGHHVSTVSGCLALLRGQRAQDCARHAGWQTSQIQV